MPNETAELSRRSLLKLSGSSTAFMLAGSAVSAAARNSKKGSAVQPTQDWDKVFPRSDRGDHQKVTFKNRFGITLVGDLYLPKERRDRRLPALAVGGPFGAVKE